jgi:site-specific DNA recombinase
VTHPHTTMSIGENAVLKVHPISFHEGIPYAAYCRYSSDRQRESSIEDQIRAARAEAKTLGGYIPDENIFCDRDVRGADHNKPELERLKAIVRSGKANFSDLIMWDTSRLARDTGLAAQLRKFFGHNNIRMHFLSNGMVSGNSGFDMQHTFQSLMDEQYSTQFGERVYRAQTGLLLKGFHPSGKCYGYQHLAEEHPTKLGLYGRKEVIGVRLILHHEEVAVIQMIYQMYASGAGGYTVIAQRLNALGILSPRRPRKGVRGWGHSAVRFILNNERYRGINKHGRKQTVRDPETGKATHRDRPEHEWTVYVDSSLQIIPDSLWEEVRARQKLNSAEADQKKRGGLNRASQPYPLGGLLRCGICKGPMVLTNGPTGSYKCSSKRIGSGCTNGQLVRRSSLEQLLMERLAVTVRSSQTRQEMKALFMAELTAELSRQDELSLHGASTERSLQDERQKIAVAVENLMDEIAEYGGSEGIRSLLRRKESRLAAIDKQLAELRAPRAIVKPAEIDAFLEKALNELGTILLGDPVRSRDELQKRVGSLTLTPIVHEGRAAYRITGKLELFSGKETVMLGDTVHSVAKHHCQSINLDHLVLKLDNRGDVVAILDVKEVQDERGRFVGEANLSGV